MSDHTNEQIRVDDLLPDAMFVEPFVRPFFDSLAESLPSFEGNLTGTWDDTEQAIQIRSVGKVRRGGNQWQRWWTFDAEVTGPDGERLPITRVRVGRERGLEVVK
jgi:hypothetical protein